MLKMKKYWIIINLISIILVAGCGNKPNEPEISEPRWKLISHFGEERITQLHVNELNNQLSVTSKDKFGIIYSGSEEPAVTADLQTPTHDCYNYIPFITDEYYFYCNVNGQYLHIGSNLTGELIGSIPINAIVDSVNLPAQFTRSQGFYYSNHIKYHDGMYMISIRHLAIPQDDWLYFGQFDFSGDEPAFLITKKIRAYEEYSTTSVWVNGNYYYGGYFWQYRSDNFNPSVCAVNETDLSVIYTDFGLIIRTVYEYYDYLLGFFDGPVKKSYDGGFTWEDWICLNAPWNHVLVDGVNVLFFSHNLGSINFDTLETANYENGELHSHCIVVMAEFDNKVFAGTLDGLYYCALEDFFIPISTTGTREVIDLQIMD
jgi:hypothetical protein